MCARSRTRWPWILAAVVVAAAAWGVWYGLDQWRLHIGDLDPARPRDLRRLREIADAAEPLLAAIEKYRERHGVYPPDLDPLFGEFLPASDADARGWRGWTYWTEDPDGCAVYYKLGFDPTLWCDVDAAGHRTWSFDLADGSGESTIVRFNTAP